MQLNREDYRRKVLGCWMGKNIGGTLGAPFEFWRQVNDVEFYTQDLGGEPLPNDVHPLTHFAQPIHSLSSMSYWYHGYSMNVRVMALVGQRWFSAPSLS